MKATKKELFYNQLIDEWESVINDAETNKRLKIIFGDLLTKYNLKNKKLLEVGCGLGYFSKKALELGSRVTGLDVGNKLVERCKKIMPKGKFVVGSASNLPFKDNSFDVVICTEVVEHVDNQLGALLELHRVVKKGGYVVFTTPNRVWHPIFNLLSLIKLRPYHGNEKWFFTWELKSIFVKEGFQIVKERYFNFIYPNNLFDRFENFQFLRNLMINQGYLLKKLK